MTFSIRPLITALISPLLRGFGINDSQVTFPPSARIEYLSVEEITGQNLAKIFELGGYKITPDGENSLILEDCGTRILVMIGRQSNQIRFLMSARFKDGVSQQQIHEFLINTNRKALMIRLSSEDERLMIDYDLPCDGGVLVRQINYAVRMFMRLALEAVYSHDKDGIIR